MIKAASFLSLGDVLGEICARHRIDAQDIQMPVDSSMQQVAIVNRQFVVRFATDPEAEVRLSAEAQLLESLQSVIPTSRVLHCGRLKAGYYQIRTCLPGQTLANLWHELGTSSKQAIVTELIAILRRLHQQRFRDFGYVSVPEHRRSSWKDFIVEEFGRIATALDSESLLPRSLITSAQEYFHQASSCFGDDETATLVHNDFWPGNIIVANGSTVGFIDFERALRAPHDADIYKMQCFCHEPELFGRTGDFRDLYDLLMAGYPELFRAPQLTTRLALYRLLSRWNAFLFGWRSRPDRSAVDPAPLIRLTQIVLEGGTSIGDFAGY